MMLTPLQLFSVHHNPLVTEYAYNAEKKKRMHGNFD